MNAPHIEPHYILRSSARADALMQVDHALTLLHVIASTAEGATSRGATDACQWLARVQAVLEDAEVEA